MATDEVVFSCAGVTVFKDGRVERAPYDPPPVPASETPDSVHNVATRDVKINDAHGTWARIYRPSSGYSRKNDVDVKLPVLLYFHGGGFFIGTTATPLNHNYLLKLAAEAGVVIVSVDYRLAPEDKLPAAYEDCYEALLWLDLQAGHADGNGLPDPWLAAAADFSRCFIVGDSAGANIVHHVAMKALSGIGFREGERDCPRPSKLGLKGLIFGHPFFTCGGPEEDPLLKQIWELSGAAQDHWYADPLVAEGAGDPAHYLLAVLNSGRCRFPGCLVYVAGKDLLRERGVAYHQGLLGGRQDASLFESPDEDHGFHFFSPDSPAVPLLLQRITDFINST